MASTPPPLFPRAALRLGFLSLAPLAACGLIALTGDDAVAQAGALGFAIYAACLLSFLGGVRCGMEIMRAPDTPDPVRLALSAIPSIAGWLLALFVVMIPAAWGAASAFAGLFAAQFVWDRRSAIDAGAPRWYPILRQVLTGGVMIACLILPLADVLHRLGYQ